MSKCQVNPNNDTMCCIACGRDTTSSSGVCYRCGGKFGAHISDRKDRHVIQIDGDPFHKYESSDSDEIDNK